jgi:ferredoxin
MTARYTVVAAINGVSHTFTCSDDQTVLAAAEAAGVELPSSCCSALLSEGSVHQPDAMGVKAELQQQGYALLCVAFPRSDLKLQSGMEDTLYEAQFGQFQK